MKSKSGVGYRHKSAGLFTLHQTWCLNAMIHRGINQINLSEQILSKESVVAAPYGNKNILARGTSQFSAPITIF